jgi:hypothetical protein
VVTSIPSHNEVQKFVSKLSETFTDTEILLSGYQVVGQDLVVADNVKILNKMDDLIDIVESL